MQNEYFLSGGGGGGGGLLILAPRGAAIMVHTLLINNRFVVRDISQTFVTYSGLVRDITDRQTA